MSCKVIQPFPLRIFCDTLFIVSLDKGSGTQLKVRVLLQQQESHMSSVNGHPHLVSRDFSFSVYMDLRLKIGMGSDVRWDFGHSLNLCREFFVCLFGKLIACPILERSLLQGVVVAKYQSTLQLLPSRIGASYQYCPRGVGNSSTSLEIPLRPFTSMVT